VHKNKFARKPRLSYKIQIAFCIAILSISLLSMNSYANTDLADDFNELSITYKLKIRSKSYGNATLGKLTNTFSKTADGFTVKSVTKTQGIAAILIGSNEQQSCDFIMQDGYAIPQRYTGGTLKKDKYNVDFNWQEQTLTFENGESMDIPKGYIVDICSMPYALALQKGQGLEELTMYVVDGKKKRIRGYTLLSSEQESIETPLGIKQTTKIVLQRELRPDRILTLWLSSSDQYVPVKIEEKRKSRTTTMMVSDLSIE